MLRNDAVDSDQSLVSSSTGQSWSVEIPGAPPVRLQTLDLARHVASAPDGTCYVVATFDDNRTSGQYVTAIYPQQNGYLTLIRLIVGKFKSETPEQALQLHTTLIQTLQQGKLSEFMRSHAK